MDVAPSRLTYYKDADTGAVEDRADTAERVARKDARTVRANAKT
jgi:hypothetical protein